MKLQQSQVQALVAKWIPRLGLQDWDIEVTVGRLGASAYASTSARHDSYRAKIVFNRDFYAVAKIENSIGRADLEATVVHELLHVVTSHLRTVATGIIDDQIGGNLGAELVERIQDEDEKLVDKLSVSLARSWQ